MITFTTETQDERRSRIVTALKDKIGVVEFTKVDGTKRIMPCTLDTKYMPQVAVTEYHKTRLHNPATISVWCTDKEAWRSFRINNVLSIT